MLNFGLPNGLFQLEILNQCPEGSLHFPKDGSLACTSEPWYDIVYLLNVLRNLIQLFTPASDQHGQALQKLELGTNFPCRIALNSRKKFSIESRSVMRKR